MYREYYGLGGLRVIDPGCKASQKSQERERESSISLQQKSSDSVGETLKECDPSSPSQCKQVTTF